MKITARFLRDMDACPEQVDKFKELYPRGLNMKTFDYGVIKAMEEQGLDVIWIYNRAMPDVKYLAIRDSFSPLFTECMKLTGYTWASDSDSWESKLYRPLQQALSNARDHVLAKEAFTALEKKAARKAAIKKGAKRG